MKNKSRRFLAGILAGIIGVQLLGGAVVESHAEAEAKVEVRVTDQGDPVSKAAAVVVDLPEGSVTLTGSQDGLYQAGTVSANAVAGRYEVTVEAVGYETSTQEADFTVAGWCYWSAVGKRQVK